MPTTLHDHRDGNGRPIPPGIYSGGGQWVIGADEVGSGPLAGPVTVCAVLVLDNTQPVQGVTDSKALTPSQRERLSKALHEAPEVRFALASRPASDIDRVGIKETLRQCYDEAIHKVLALQPTDVRVVIDGQAIRGLVIPAPTEYIIKGDAKVWSIGAASIIAKVWRDAYMADEARSYPHYGWEENAGYGTKGHTTAIRVYGLTPQHRQSFCRRFTKPLSPDLDQPAAEDLIWDLFG